MENDPVEQFAAEAALFEAWARDAADEGDWAAREALIRITRLYLAALQLPQAWNGDLSDEAEPDRVNEEEWRAIYEHSARLPLGLYSVIYDPSVIPPEEPVVGSIADDIADIYREVVSGLRALRAGLRAEAIWTWGFGLRTHWGQHATGAIRTLHCWLAENAADRLSQTI
jgi:hypothetical protein